MIEVAEEKPRRNVFLLALGIDIILAALHIINGLLILLERTTLFPDVEERFALLGIESYLGYILLIFGFIILIGFIFAVRSSKRGYHLLVITSILVLAANLFSLVPYRMIFGVILLLIHLAGLPAVKSEVCDISSLICLKPKEG